MTRDVEDALEDALEDEMADIGCECGAATSEASLSYALEEEAISKEQVSRLFARGKKKGSW